MFDLYSDIKVVQLAALTDQAGTDVQSDYVDLLGWEACIIGVQVGQLTGIDGNNYLTPVIQEATATPASAVSYSTVTATEVHGAFTKMDAASEDGVVQYVGYLGNNRYLNVKFDYTNAGALSAGYCGAWAILGRSKVGPASGLTPTTGTVT
jgi:hypothetical protein